MNRHEKELLVQDLRTNLQKSQALFIVGTQGLTVSQMQDLRRKLRKQGAVLKVAKNTLVKIASDSIPHLEPLQPYLKSQVAVVMTEQEPPAVAQVLWNTAQDNKQFTLVVGCYEATLLDTNMIKFLATLPARPVLVAQVCGTLKAPLVAPVRIMHLLIARLLFVLQQAAEKNSD